MKENKIRFYIDKEIEKSIKELRKIEEHIIER